MRAIGYVRLSKPKKNKDGTMRADPYSIQAQTDAIRRAVEYNGWDLVDVLVDNGKTGTNTNRDGYQEALQRLKLGEADVLVAARYDRLTRSTKDLIDLMDLSTKQGWAVSILDQRVDTTTAVGRLMARTLASHAEFERDLISERTRDALAVVKADGQELGRKSPITAEVKRKVRRWRKQGVSASAIARRLTEQGEPTPSGKPWHHSVIVDLIRREGWAA